MMRTEGTILSRKGITVEAFTPTVNGIARDVETDNGSLNGKLERIADNRLTKAAICDIVFMIVNSSLFFWWCLNYITGSVYLLSFLYPCLTSIVILHTTHYTLKN